MVDPRCALLSFSTTSTSGYPSSSYPHPRYRSSFRSSQVWLESESVYIPPNQRLPSSSASPAFFIGSGPQMFLSESRTRVIDELLEGASFGARLHCF